MAGNSVRVVVVAFIMNLGIAIAKYVAFLFTGSAAMLAEAVHSLADTSNQVFLYMGIRRSSKAASSTHQFGYGMEQYVFSFLVAILIFSLGGAFSLYEGVHKLLEPTEKLEHAMINLIVLGVAILLEGYSSFVATKELKKTMGGRSFFQYIRRTKDQVLVTVLFEDYAALLGLTIAGLGMLGYVLTGFTIFDTIATLLIGVLLVAIAVVLYREAKSLLVGEAASPEDQEKIRKAFKDHPAVERLDELLTMHLAANQILVNAHVKFKGGLTLEEVEDIIDEIEDVIIDQVPEVFKIFIETHQKSNVEPFQRRQNHPQGHEDAPAKRRSVMRTSKTTEATGENPESPTLNPKAE
jgi:cation diffusion facilitator family transporter